MNQQILEEDLELNIVRWILLISERFHLTADYILAMSITQYIEYKNYLIFVAEEEKNAQPSTESGTNQKRNTFG